MILDGLYQSVRGRSLKVGEEWVKEETGRRCDRTGVIRERERRIGGLVVRTAFLAQPVLVT
jgi:hypothetical protein